MVMMAAHVAIYSACNHVSWKKVDIEFHLLYTTYNNNN